MVNAGWAAPALDVIKQLTPRICRGFFMVICGWGLAFPGVKHALNRAARSGEPGARPYSFWCEGAACAEKVSSGNGIPVALRSAPQAEASPSLGEALPGLCSGPVGLLALSYWLDTLSNLYLNWRNYPLYILCASLVHAAKMWGEWLVSLPTG